MYIGVLTALCAHGSLGIRTAGLIILALPESLFLFYWHGKIQYCHNMSTSPRSRFYFGESFGSSSLEAFIPFLQHSSPLPRVSACLALCAASPMFISAPRALFHRSSASRQSQPSAERRLPHGRGGGRVELTTVSRTRRLTRW